MTAFLALAVATLAPSRAGWADTPPVPDTGSSCTYDTGDPYDSVPELLDFDGDGDLDVLLVSHDFDMVGLYLNDGAATFSAFQPLTTAADGPLGARPYDRDGDGDLDLLVWSSFDAELAWYDNQSGTLVGPELVSCGDAPYAALPIQVDADEAPEIVTTNPAASRIDLLHDDGGAWSATPVPNDLVPPSTLGAADLDGDGDADLLADGGNHGRLVWFAQEAGAFGPAIDLLPLFAAKWSPIEVTDFEPDGDFDVVVATWTLVNDGTGTMAASEQMGLVTAGDVDGDGDIDLIDALDDIWIERTADGWTVTHPLGVGAVGIRVADLDGDGDGDLLSTSERGLHVFLQTPTGWVDHAELSVRLCDGEITSHPAWGASQTPGCPYADEPVDPAETGETGDTGDTGDTGAAPSPAVPPVTRRCGCATNGGLPWAPLLLPFVRRIRGGRRRTG
ncbi:MAG: VCBS repeat-containing protein [Alphaproteobacteria bacterium]|nr:VCBS repeat-containing protein [Alphaproteobacteria bacterium]